MLQVRSFRPDKILKPRVFTAPLLPATGALDLEIGCGAGWHPIEYAKANPDRFLIAIEHTKTRFAAFERRWKSHSEPKNLFPIHADAVAWITHALVSSSVDRVLFLYPNPYPKRSDRGKRWHAMPFMERLLEVLKPGGEILLATNERFYFEEAREFFDAVWKTETIEALEFTSETVPGGGPRTHFEKKYLARGERCFQLRVRKPWP